MDLQHAEGLLITERKGNRRRGNGRRRGGIAIRDSAVIEKEHRALTMLVKGHSQKAIALELDMSEAGISVLIRRALELRAKALEPYVEQARTLLIERYERLLERWWPMATGDYVDPTSETGESPPSVAAVTVVLKIMEHLAKITGADRGPVISPDPNPSGGGIHVDNVHIYTQGEREVLQSKALERLRNMREKQTVIDGELARVGTTQAHLTGQAHNDKPAPPPRTGDQQ
jgi:DNA-binding CsgD family transcriptional regulator